jgi:hypothetical protein
MCVHTQNTHVHIYLIQEQINRMYTRQFKHRACTYLFTSVGRQSHLNHQPSMKEVTTRGGNPTAWVASECPAGKGQYSAVKSQCHHLYQSQPAWNWQNCGLGYLWGWVGSRSRTCTTQDKLPSKFSCWEVLRMCWLHWKRNSFLGADADEWS